VTGGDLENPKGRYCANCLYFRRSWVAVRFSKCTRPQVPDKVTGRQPETFCSVERGCSSGCGTEGFYYVARHQLGEGVPPDS